MALRDVSQQQPHCTPCFSTSPVPGLLGSQGQGGPRDFGPSEAEILLQPGEPPVGLQPTSAFPAGAAQEGGRADWWALHVCTDAFGTHMQALRLS